MLTMSRQRGFGWTVLDTRFGIAPGTTEVAQTPDWMPSHRSAVGGADSNAEESDWPSTAPSAHADDPLRSYQRSYADRKGMNWSGSNSASVMTTGGTIPFPPGRGHPDRHCVIVAGGTAAACAGSAISKLASRVHEMIAMATAPIQLRVESIMPGSIASPMTPWTA